MERFDMKSVDELQQIRDTRVTHTIAENTMKNTNWAVTTWNKWAEWRNSVSAERGDDELTHIPSNEGLADLPDEALAKFLTLYACEVKREDGSNYSPDTLYNLLCGMNRYLKIQTGRSDINIFEEKGVFADFKKTLDGQIVNLNKNAAVRRTPDTVTEEQEAVLWEKGVFSFTSAQSLSYAAFHFICKQFSLRGRDTHRDLKIENFVLDEDRRGRFIECLGTTADVTSNPDNTNNTAKQNISIPVKPRKTPRTRKKYPKCYDDPSPLCAYRVLTSYLSYVPTSGPFYRKPLPPTIQEPVRFAEVAIGKNTLGEYTKNFMLQAGFEGNFTSHPSSGEYALKDSSASMYGMNLSSTNALAQLENHGLYDELHIKQENKDYYDDEDSMSETNNSLHETSDMSITSHNIAKRSGLNYSLPTTNDYTMVKPNLSSAISQQPSANKASIIQPLPNIITVVPFSASPISKTSPIVGTTQLMINSKDGSNDSIDSINRKRKMEDIPIPIYPKPPLSSISNHGNNTFFMTGPLVNNQQVALPLIATSATGVSNLNNGIPNKKPRFELPDEDTEIKRKTLEGLKLDNELKELSKVKCNLEIEQFKRLERETLELKKLEKVRMSLEIEKLRLEKEKLTLEVNSLRCAQAADL